MRPPAFTCAPQTCRPALPTAALADQVLPSPRTPRSVQAPGGAGNKAAQVTSPRGAGQVGAEQDSDPPAPPHPPGTHTAKREGVLDAAVWWLRSVL